jgi:large subunit ribosomal protein L1
MPNPKNGTITTEIGKSVSSFKAGRSNFKSQQDHGTIRMKVANVNMTPEQIKENIVAVLKAVMIEVKKLSNNPFKQVIVKPTMGSSISLDSSDIMKQI